MLSLTRSAARGGRIILFAIALLSAGCSLTPRERELGAAIAIGALAGSIEAAAASHQRSEPTWSSARRGPIARRPPIISIAIPIGRIGPERRP